MLLVDRAVGSNHLVGPLCDQYGIDAHLADLDFGGDVAFNGRGESDTTLFIGVELKTLPDLLQSISSKRLAGHQLLKMTQAYDRRYLIIEGDYQVNREGQMCRWGRAGGQKMLTPMRGAPLALTFEKELLTLQHRGGLYVRHTGGKTGTYLYLAALYRWWTDRTLDQHKSHLALYAPDMDRRLNMPMSPFRAALSALKCGLGYSGSAAVELACEGSWRRMMTWTAEEWAALEVRGEDGKTRRLGAKRAAKILEALQ